MAGAMNRFAALIVCALSVASPVQAAGLKAGVAQVDITPPLGLPMYGYASRKGTSTGVLDPLMARVLVLEAGDKRLAWVVMDLGTVFAPAWIERLRAQALEKAGISYVIVAAIHTHSGPAIRDQYPPPELPDWETGVLEKVESAIEDAHRHAVEARLGTGYGVIDIGHNRLRVNPDGTVTWFERNNTRVPTAPVDPTVSVLRVDSRQGQPIAIVVNYACHPVVFGSDNLRYSADWPGVMIKTVEQAFEGPPREGAANSPSTQAGAGREGGQPLAMFWQGADGDINPYYAVHPLAEDAVKMRDWTGERLGREAARVAETIRTQDAPDASLEFVEDLLDFHLRWDREKFRAALLKSWGPQAAAVFDRRGQEPLRLPVATVLINKRIALMTMPGEPFVEFQIDWRNRCPVRDAFFMGYANGSFGYFPPIRAASLGGYGAANTATFVEPGAGERMVEHALVRLYEMLGKLSNLPEDLKRQ
jgi:hypothetical protein